MSRVPRVRMPVPASRMTTLPSPSVSSTQDVLPPYRTVDGPGDAIDPRHPQTRASTSGRPHLRVGVCFPERDEHAGEVVRRTEQRQGDDVNPGPAHHRTGLTRPP